jgi:hypothetical protein
MAAGYKQHHCRHGGFSVNGVELLHNASAADSGTVCILVAPKTVVCWYLYLELGKGKAIPLQALTST